MYQTFCPPTFPTSYTVSHLFILLHNYEELIWMACIFLSLYTLSFSIHHFILSNLLYGDHDVLAFPSFFTNLAQNNLVEQCFCSLITLPVAIVTFQHYIKDRFSVIHANRHVPPKGMPTYGWCSRFLLSTKLVCVSVSIPKAIHNNSDMIWTL